MLSKLCYLYGRSHKKNKVRVHNFSESVTLKQYRHTAINHRFYLLRLYCNTNSCCLDVLLEETSPSPFHFISCTLAQTHNLCGQMSRLVLNKYLGLIWAWDFCGFFSLCRKILGLVICLKRLLCKSLQMLTATCYFTSFNC